MANGPLAPPPIGDDEGDSTDPVARTGDRLAALLLGTGGGLSDPGRGDLVFDEELRLRPLERLDPPSEVWAVDGGQALVADARTLAVYATRAASVCWRDGAVVDENEGDLRLHLLGCGEERAALAALGSPVPSDTSVDVNLLRDWGEWEAVHTCVARAAPGAMVLVDGDLQPDWRLPSSWLSGLLAFAAERAVTLCGVTKHSSLARGGAPLLGALERRAEGELGARQRWWSRVALTRTDVEPSLQVLVARLDPDARFSFRVDLPADVDAGAVLGRLAASCDDAAFPGYPYPLSAADRLAACPRWLRDELWDRVHERLSSAGVPAEVAERAFADRHRLMERA